jgi:aminopeptidase N
VFQSVLKQMRKTAMDKSDQGPVYLGYRLGHIRNEGRVFRALVYNKGAAVLHMLRRLVGDEPFFRGLQRFYMVSRFKKVGTEEFRSAMEMETGRKLDRFFERWIYGSTLPKLKLAYRVEGSDLVVHVEQIGAEIFDVPLTLTLQYADRKPVDVVVAVTDRAVDQRIRLAGTLRGVEFNKDDGTLADVVK